MKAMLIGLETCKYVILQYWIIDLLAMCASFKKQTIPSLFVDINECNEATSGCEQICTNVPGSAECSCYTGYTADGNTCILGTIPIFS